MRGRFGEASLSSTWSPRRAAVPPAGSADDRRCLRLRIRDQRDTLKARSILLRPRVRGRGAGLPRGFRGGDFRTGDPVAGRRIRVLRFSATATRPLGTMMSTTSAERDVVHLGSANADTITADAARRRCRRGYEAAGPTQSDVPALVHRGGDIHASRWSCRCARSRRRPAPHRRRPHPPWRSRRLRHRWPPRRPSLRRRPPRRLRSHSCRPCPKPAVLPARPRSPR